MRKTLFTLILVFGLGTTAFAQRVPTRTTLSAAMTAGVGSNQMTVASATGITVSGCNASGTGMCYLMVDQELMRITAISGTTVTVTRAQNSTFASAHISGATVVYGNVGQWTPTTGNASGTFIGDRPYGSCTRGNQQFLPVFNVAGGNAYNCIGGKWVAQTLPDAVMTNVRECNFKFTPTVVSTTGAAGTVYVSSIFIPYTRWYTGLSVLNGATVGTSLTLVTLYDNAGSLIANASTAGVSGGTASTMWDIAFTSPTFITGPARYFVGVQNSGATATFGLAGSLQSYGDIVGNLRAGTFGTLPNITIPTAFVSVQTPVMCAY